MGFDSLELGVDRVDSLELGVGIQRWGSTALNCMPTCRGGISLPCTGCGHAEVGFDSLELGVGMQRWGSKALYWVWACRGGVRQP